MSEEIVSSEDIQFYEYLGLLEQAYYDTHVGSKAGTIIAETIKSYVNILKYKNNKLQQKVEELEKENKKLKEDNAFLKNNLSKLSKKYIKNDLLNILNKGE